MSDKHNPVPMKDRMKIKRQHMPEQAPEVRAHNFVEVNLGYQPELAKCEASRCIECAKPACMQECPVGVKVREFLDLVLDGDYLGAIAKIREDNVLPAVTGRVCPQDDQCEHGCVLGKKGEPLAIGNIERFVADFEQASGKLSLPPIAPPTGKKVAIVGSGPAGLSAAGDLVQKGHRVRVFEALHELGGVLVYGIPEFRLPKEIVRQEIENMRKMGVEFETNVVVGKTVTIDELMNNEGYDAVFVCTGAGLPQFMGVAGENLNGVYSANEFLTRVNLMRAYRFPEFDEPVYDVKGKNVMVVGGGNTAMDAVRTSLRLGAANAYLVYRRAEEDMPARTEEIKHAKEEGVQFMTLHNPVELLGENGWLKAARLTKMQPGELDASGRPRPVPIKGSEFDLPISVCIVAVGTTANPLVQSTTPELKTNKKGYIAVTDQTNLRTSKRGVFAGGDIVTGGATVILAMGAGRNAAKSIHEYLTTGVWDVVATETAKA